MGYNIEKNKNGKYQVIKDGASRATRVFDNYNDAKDYLEEIEGKNKKKKSGKKTVTAGKVVIAMILGLIIGFAIGYFTPLNTKKDPMGVVSDGELTIHFLELGNEYTGDSVYIKAGENEFINDDVLLEDMKNHTVTAVFDRGTKVVCFTTDGIFCDGGEKRQFGFTRFNDDFKVTFGNMSDEKMKFAKGIHLYS